MKIVKNIKLRIVIFTALKNRCILHGCVFVMHTDNNNRSTAVINDWRGELNLFIKSSDI